MSYITHNSLYEPHGTYVSGFTFLLHQEGPKKKKWIFSLSWRGWNSLPGARPDLDVCSKFQTYINCCLKTIFIFKNFLYCCRSHSFFLNYSFSWNLLHSAPYLNPIWQIFGWTFLPNLTSSIFCLFFLLNQ